MSPKLRTLLLVVALVLPLDQLTKHLVTSNIEPGDYWVPFASLGGFLHIVHSRNPGAALGLAPHVHGYFFVAFSLLALGLLGSLFRRLAPADRLSALSLGLISAGAIGNNWCDRIFRGEVIDFLQFDLGIFVFPTFNVADSAIVIGVALLLLEVVTQETERSTAAKGAPEERG